jgi:hypothetical protein
MSVRPHTRSVDVLVPDGVSRLVVEGGGLGYETAVIRDRSGAVAAIPLSESGGEIMVSEGPTSLNVRMLSRSAIDPNEIPDPRWSPWPVARRLLTEARDRTRPWVNARRGQ